MSVAPEAALSPQDWASLASNVPEPVSLLAAPALLGLSLRRRRRTA
jgi:hypothetical protein